MQGENVVESTYYACQKSIPGIELKTALKNTATNILSIYKNSLSLRLIQLKLKILTYIRVWVIILKDHMK